MDTRSKIVTPESLPRSFTLVTGYFDMLRPVHVRTLEQVRSQNPQIPVVIMILPGGGEWLAQPARARMAAGLRVVDYVLFANHEDPDAVLEGLYPLVVVRLEAAEMRSKRLLIEHVQRGQAQ